MALMLVLFTYSLLVLGENPNLKGAQTLEEKPVISLESWMDGSYQSQFEKSASSNFVFYPTLVKTRNQWDYWMWNRTLASGVVIGEDNYLFEQIYIDGYYGINSIDKQKHLNSKRAPIRYVNQRMNALNHKLVFLIMPSKTFLYPDKIPIEQQQKNIPSKHILDDFLTFAKKEKLNVIDFQKYFLEEQTNSTYPIFPKRGIHLSEYSESIVLDSLLNYIERQQGKNIYDYHFDEIVESTKPLRRDDDIAQALNLLTPLKNEEILAYRNLIIDRINKEETPKVLVIGDSFYWGLYNIIDRKQLFKKHEFWYRNGKIFPPAIKGSKTTSDLGNLQSLTDFDITFIVVTANDMNNAGWGYFKSIYNQRSDKTITPKETKRVNQIINNLKNNPENLSLVKEKAKNKNISLDSMLYLDAKWLYDRQN